MIVIVRFASMRPAVEFLVRMRFVVAGHRDEVEFVAVLVSARAVVVFVLVLVRMGVRVPVGVRMGHVAVAVLVIVGVHVLVRMFMHVATPLGMSWIAGHAGPSGR